MDYARRKRMLVYALGALGVTSYGAYRVYNSPVVIKKRRRLFKLFRAFFTVVEMVSDSSETIGIVAKDLKQFIQSDSDQIPRSLLQISKISRSVELSESVTRITRAVTIGILTGCQYEQDENGVKTSSGTLPDRVLDKLFSDAGSGFVSVIVGSFAKNLVKTCFDVLHEKNNSEIGEWVNVLCEEKVRGLIGECVQTFVSTAVAVYLVKTMHINACDEIFSGLTNPKHGTKVRDLLVSLCSGGIETFVKTSHNVLTQSDSVSKSSFDGKLFRNGQLMSNTLKGLSKMSSSLAVPSNSMFLLDLTGRVSSETFRSFMKLLINKMSQIVIKSGDVVLEEVVGQGAEAFEYASEKTSVVANKCMSLCLHILNSPWLLVHS